MHEALHTPLGVYIVQFEFEDRYLGGPSAAQAQAVSVRVHLRQYLLDLLLRSHGGPLRLLLVAVKLPTSMENGTGQCPCTEQPACEIHILRRAARVEPKSDV